MAPSKEELEEHKHFMRVVQAYQNYSADAKERLDRTKESYKRIPAKHKELLKLNGFDDNLKNIENCIDFNAAIITEFVGKLTNFSQVSFNSRFFLQRVSKKCFKIKHKKVTPG